MTKTRIMIVVCFLLAFGAGVAVGILTGGSPRRPRRGSWITHELNLTPTQREEMRKIWSELMGDSRRGQREQRKRLEQERNEAVKALLSPEQKLQYEELMAKYARKTKELSAEREEALRQAVERTKELLTEPQRKKYDELLKKRGERGRRHGRRRSDAPESGDQPAAE